MEFSNEPTNKAYKLTPNTNPATDKKNKILELNISNIAINKPVTSFGIKIIAPNDDK